MPDKGEKAQPVERPRFDGPERRFDGANRILIEIACDALPFLRREKTAIEIGERIGIERLDEDGPAGRRERPVGLGQGFGQPRVNQRRFRVDQIEGARRKRQGFGGALHTAQAIGEPGFPGVAAQRGQPRAGKIEHDDLGALRGQPKRMGAQPRADFEAKRPPQRRHARAGEALLVAEIKGPFAPQVAPRARRSQVLRIEVRFPVAARGLLVQCPCPSGRDQSLGRMTISTRRLRARPATDALSATFISDPMPTI
ncbi:MAG: hypothetical protein BWZ10_02412 [candidate division BRC1 bacterium ADurb.BinA364]|nr:MAG: hypothetical protein BWZ10_02412 [candidate division BRC1 bacterium ADurb.BinA364]